jgi:hypothetical protein
MVTPSPAQRGQDRGLFCQRADRRNMGKGSGWDAPRSSSEAQWQGMRRQVRGERTVRRAHPRAAAGCSLRYGSLCSPPLREHPAAAIPLLSQQVNLVACVAYVGPLCYPSVGPAPTPALSLRERENPRQSFPTTHALEKFASQPTGSLSLWERARVRGISPQFGTPPPAFTDASWRITVKHPGQAIVVSGE